jgi:uncharacterized protein YdaU (DUF1376 family)
VSKFPSMPVFVDAFLADTIHLNAEETGAYTTLLYVAWKMPGNRLPDVDKHLAKWARCTPKRWKKIKPTIMAFWQLSDGFWTQKRLHREFQYVSDRAARSRQNGALGGRPNTGKTSVSDNPAGYSQDTQKQTQNVTHSKAPIHIPNPKGYQNIPSDEVRPAPVYKFVSEAALNEVPKIAPGWDRQELLTRFMNWKGSRNARDMDAAFKAWVKKITNGKPPRGAHVFVSSAIRAMPQAPTEHKED